MKQKGTVLVTLMVGGLAALSAGQPADAVPARPKRVKVAVMDFDYGTITNHWWGTSDIGKGMADQVVDGLVNDGSVIVVERKKLDTVLAEQDLAHSDRANPDAARLAQLGRVYGVKYIVMGSITKFGTEQKSYGAGAAGAALGPVGMLGFKKAKTEVGLSLRVVDASTGEIVLAASAAGLSKKGGGLSVNTLGKAGDLGFSMGTDDYKSSAIGEAQEKACQQLMQVLLAKVATLE